MDIRKLLKDIWKLLKGETPEERLRRIEVLIVSIALLLLIAYVLKFYSWWAHSRFLRRILLIFEGISDSMITYSIGLMQQATPPEDFSSMTFSIWAIVLLILGNNYYNDFDRSKVQRLKSFLASLMNYLYSFYLNLFSLEPSTKSSIVVWILWFLHLCKFALRSWIFEVADASYRHGKNSRLIADYMCYEHELSEQEECNPATMYGYKYLVHGESKSKLEPKEPDYLVKLQVGNEDKLITLDKVWGCKGRLLNSNGDPDYKLKDVCLSFALYKLIRRRFDYLHPPPEADHRKAHVLFHEEGLLSVGTYTSGNRMQGESTVGSNTSRSTMTRESTQHTETESTQQESQDYKRVFRVIGTELAFLSDYFHSLLPALLFTRFRVFYALIFASFGMSLCLLVIIALKQQLVFEFFITIVLVCMVILMGVLEVVYYVFSDWTKLLLLCKYVEHHSWHGNVIVEMLVRFLCGTKFLEHWHNKICQYHLLKSFCHDSILRGRKESTESEFKTMVREGPRVKVPEKAKEAIFVSLREQISSGRLSNGTVSLQRNQVDRKLSWACKMRTNVHTILVWHVATCFCEINMSLRHCVAGRSVRNCFRPSSFILDWRSLNGAKLQANYVVASSLSQYCAYLLVFCPKLLRYHELTINFILEKTAVEAREILMDGRARSINNMYNKLWGAANGVMGRQGADNVMRMGARLGRTLVEDIVDEEDTEDIVDEENKVDEERIWKVLAEFWAEMVLYIAPCVNKDAHEEQLNTGGEFLTHLWALLHHAGIDQIDDEAPVPEVAQEEQQHQPASPAASPSDMC